MELVNETPRERVMREALERMSRQRPATKHDTAVSLKDAVNKFRDIAAEALADATAIPSDRVQYHDVQEFYRDDPDAAAVASEPVICHDENCAMIAARNAAAKAATGGQP